MKNNFLKMILIYILENCDFITPNNGSHAQLINSLGIPLSKIRTIYNGIDTNQFKPRNKEKIRERIGLPLDKIIILFIGILNKRKGIQYLILSLPKIIKKYNKTILVTIGDGSKKDEMIDLVKDLEISDHVLFCGTKSPDQIPFWMNASDIFILPSLSEGKPNVVGEALASNLPVIATNINGTPEFIEHGKNGLLINPRSISDIENNLLLLLDNKELRSKLIRNSRKSIIRSCPSWEKSAEHYVKIYHKVIIGSK